MLKLKWVGGWLLMLVSSMLVCRADTIVIASDSWCPFNCEPGSDEPGYMVEIARYAFAQHGHEVEYRITPWARALLEARKGNIQGVIGPYVEDAPDFIFPRNELAMIGFSMFALNSSSWSYTGVNSLDKVVLGVISGYAYNEAIDEYIAIYQHAPHKVQIRAGTEPMQSNIRKMLNWRIDVLIAAEPVFWYMANKLDVQSQVKSAGVAVTAREAYIAFSPALPQSQTYAEILSKGIDDLRGSGKLETILAKYGLKDWRQ